MKHRIFSLIALCLGIFASCDLNRPYLNGPNASSFPNNKEEVEAGVFASYKALTLLSASETPFVAIQDHATDIASMRYGNQHMIWQQTSLIALDNAWLLKTYRWIFKVVGRCNLVLDGMAALENPYAFMTEEEFNAYRAEALLIRSYVYNMACQLWGDFPYIVNSMDLDVYYERTPREEIIDKILNEDLRDEIIECLPIRFNKAVYGSSRLGRVGAYGLKARICLDWGMFEDAAYYADKALTLAQEAGYDLTAYNTDFCGGDHTQGEPSATNLFGFDGLANSNELIWTMEFNSMIDGNQHNSGYYNASRLAGGCSLFSPSQALIDAFQCIDGKSIAESPLYDWRNPWVNRDPRLDLFCLRPNTRCYGIEFQTNPSIDEVMNYNTGQTIVNSEASAKAAKSEYGANGAKGPCGYLWRKYIDIQEYHNLNNSFGSGIVECTLPYPLMRLSELYLIRAEALIELGTDLTTAKKDIEAIRRKASMPNLTASSQAELRSALRYERLVELCNEGFRWFDIRRWDIANTVMNDIMYAPAHNGDVPNAIPSFDENWHVTYSGETYDNKPMNFRIFYQLKYDPARDINWPIPQEETIAMPSVGQNPGW